MASTERVQRIQGTYRDDLNLLDLHRKMLKFFEDRKRDLPQLRSKMQDVEQSMNTARTIIDYKTLSKKKQQLEEEIADIEQGKSFEEYKQRTADILQQYKQIGTAKKVIKFGKKQEKLKEDEETNRRRHVLISQYLQVIRDYIPVDVHREISKKDCCPYCGQSWNYEQDCDDGTLVCGNCGLEKSLIYRHSDNSSRLEYPEKNDYEDRVNFWDALVRHQGKQSVDLPEGLWSDLDNYFASKGLPTSKEIRSKPPNKRGGKNGTSLRIMIKALGDTGHSKQYKNANLICAKYWGWKLLDLTGYEEEIMKNYDKAQAIYREIKGNERTSSLGTEFLKYAHLYHMGYDVRVQDFRIAETEDIRNYYMRIWEHITQRLGWERLPL